MSRYTFDFEMFENGESKGFLTNVKFDSFTDVVEYLGNIVSELSVYGNYFSQAKFEVTGSVDHNEDGFTQQEIKDVVTNMIDRNGLLANSVTRTENDSEFVKDET